MEIGNIIKFHRSRLEISQEELAKKIFVSRQSISNWENDKTYPDINSLVLLSKFFNVSLDDLVKGDIDKMKEQIQKTKPTEIDIKAFNKFSLILVILLVSVILINPFIIVFSYKYNMILYGIIVTVVLLFVLIYYGFKVEKLKKKYDIQTYREILAFTEGKELSKTEKLIEVGKRQYEDIIFVLSGILFTIILFLIFKFFVNYYNIR